MEILHSRIYGEDKPGTPLLVMHGLFGMSDNWGSFAREFGQDRPVHLLDLRNHGHSFHSEEMSLAVMVDDLEAYIDHHGLQEVDILGHSLGGKVAMQYAVSKSTNIRKLIIADIAPKAYPPHHQKIIEALQAVKIDEASNRGEVEEQLREYLNETGVIQFLLKNVYIKEDRTLDWRFNLKTLTEKYAAFITVGVEPGVYDGETLFLSGEKSNYILEEDYPMIKEMFPNSEIKTVPKAGHWVQAENPKAFNELVTQFLS
ncbi:alpha/beta fold hydrolase [Sphingobacterium phlebotomi]|uniref:Alpha/beta fold hydrolase n=1 Tax=Sphingobacterium phlebotomi TaxID=2605433 RepID=A0A5D4H9V2_9SPHI|nr:alpha/beta fold hydrolase [Sphingobacterium phlebotomi]TYR35560.1 alpha/beta fold hydrolase [Sphingobacterium phlebotomi]